MTTAPTKISDAQNGGKGYPQPHIADTPERIISSEIYESAKLFELWLIPFLCEKAGVTTEELKGPDRKDRLTLIRQAACYFLWKYTAYSLSTISAILNRKCHTAALNHIRKFITECDISAERRKTNRAIEREIVKAYRNGLIKPLYIYPTRTATARTEDEKTNTQPKHRDSFNGQTKEEER